MFDSPQNIYYMIASFALIILGTLGGVLLYKLIVILQRVDEIVTMIQDGLARVEEGIEEIAERAMSLTSYTKVISKLVQGAMTLYAKRAGFVDDDDEEEVVVKRRRKSR